MLQNCARRDGAENQAKPQRKTPDIAEMKKKPQKRPQKRPLREQIAALSIIRALEAHVLGRKKMAASQVTAALALLRKRMPDLLRRVLPPAKRRKKKDSAQGHEDALKDLE
jgi:hypothetical protein